MKCTVCNHPERHDIDRDLLAGGVSFEALKKRFGPSMSALWRHKKHLLEKMAQAEKRFLDNLRLGVLLKLNSRLERNERTAQAAEADGNSRLVLQADRDATRILTYIDKMDIQLDQDTVYRLLASPQWAQQGSLLPTAPEFIAAANQFLADKFFIPCPEPHPDLDDLDDEEEEEEYPPVGKRCDSRPEIIREISAKLPKNPHPSEQIIEQYKYHTPCEKIAAQTSCAAGKHPQGGGAQAPPAAKISTATDLEHETPPAGELQHSWQSESLFQKLHRKRKKTGKAPKYSCNSDEINEQYLKDIEPEKIADGTATGAPGLSSLFPPPFSQASAPALATENQPSDTPTPAPETPKAREPLDPFLNQKEYNYAVTHGHRLEDRPKYIPDRRWEEDFGNPRKIRGCY